MLGCLFVTIQGQIVHGKRTCSTIISTLHRDERGIGQLGQYTSRGFIYVNGICEFFLYCLFIWIESVNVFFMVSFYKCNLWMFSSSFISINGLFGWFVALFKYRTYIPICFCHYHLFAYKHFHSVLLFIYQFIGLSDLWLMLMWLFLLSSQMADLEEKKNRNV